MKKAPFGNQRLLGTMLVLILLLISINIAQVKARMPAGPQDARELFGQVIRVNTVDGFRNTVNTLQTGDTLIVEAGEYRMSYLNIQDISGTAAEPITVEAEGAVAIRAYSTGSNAVEIRNVHYFQFVGFEIWSETSPGAGIDGVKIQTDSSHITFDQLYIHHVSGNGISVFSDSHHLTLTNSEIAHTYGSGLYWGYPGRDIVHDVVIANNYIHHCPSDSTRETHYGIQFKGWGYRALIEDNVLHDVGGTTRSGLIVYYGKTPLAGDIPADVNIVRGNVLWNGRNEGITVMSDAIIENNIVFDTRYGINIQKYSDESFSGQNHVENLTVRNNTVFRCGVHCINISGWSSGIGNNVSFAGNAAYQDSAGASAINGSAGTAAVFGNLYYGVNDLISGVTAGNGLSDFLNVGPSTQVPNLDFYPSTSSALLDRPELTTEYPPQDFNHSARPENGAADAGAYERTGGNNPGWPIQEDFKPADEPPAVSLQGIPGNQTIHLRWQVTGITLPPTSTWQLSYQGPAGDPASPITNITSTLSSFVLSNLTNYHWYTVTLLLENTPSLSDTVLVMPTDRLVYLPAVMRNH